MILLYICVKKNAILLGGRREGSCVAHKHLRSKQLPMTHQFRNTELEYFVWQEKTNLHPVWQAVCSSLDDL